MHRLNIGRSRFSNYPKLAIEFFIFAKERDCFSCRSKKAAIFSDCRLVNRQTNFGKYLKRFSLEREPSASLVRHDC